MNNWKFYLDNLQGHPTRCQSNEGMNEDSVYGEVKEYFTDKSGEVLVLGAADGKEVRIFKDAEFVIVHGITLGEKNLQAARLDYKVALYNIDMHDLFNLPTTYKYVYCNQTFEHAFAPFIHCLEVYSVMEDNGIWFLKFPVNKFDEGGNQLTDTLTNQVSHHHPNMMRSEDLKILFSSTGFRILKWKQEGNYSIFLRKVPRSQLQDHGVHPNVIHTINLRTSPMYFKTRKNNE